MITAKIAAVRTKAAETRAVRQKQSAARTKEARQRAEIRRALPKEVPFALNEIEKQIRKAIRCGCRIVTRRVGTNPVDRAVWKRVEAKLQTAGYRVSNGRYESGMDNMGDFSAPCNMAWEHWTYDISW